MTRRGCSKTDADGSIVAESQLAEIVLRFGRLKVRIGRGSLRKKLVSPEVKLFAHQGGRLNSQLAASTSSLLLN
jgi:hypothetical protein